MYQFFISRSGGAAVTVKPAVASATAAAIGPIADAGAIVATPEIAIATAVVEPLVLAITADVATPEAATATALAVSPVEGPYGAIFARLNAQPAHLIDDFDAEPAYAALIGVN